MTRAAEFESTIDSAGRIALPEAVANQIPLGETVRIVVSWQEDGVDADWKALGQQRFAATYASEDSIYEQLN